MAKFVMECPNCGKYVQAKTGIFSQKKIDCICGYTINVKLDKMTSRECPHCGNVVVFDQSLGANAKCPVCHNPINTMAEQSQATEISCAQCGVRFIVSKASKTFICPVCDCVNDVAERTTSEKIKNDGLASVIKYEGDADTLVWKHPIEDFNYGSQLIVHESQEAVFFRDGQALDLFGAGRYTLETQQLPIMEKLYKLPTDTEGTFHSEIYYVNIAAVMGIKWGTDSKVRLFDPASGLHVELGACGDFNIRVINSRKLLVKLVGTTNTLKQEQLVGMGGEKGFFRGMIMTQVKSHLAQAIKTCNINILEVDEHLMELSEELRTRMNIFLQEYGLEISEFFVTRVMTPDDDPNFRRMKEQYAEQYLLVRQEQIRMKEAEAAAERKAVEASTAARIRVIGAQGDAEVVRLKAVADADAYRLQAEAEAMEMKMKGYTYQQETSRQVGLEAMKNGIGGVGGAGVIGDLTGLGIGIGAMSGVISMTKDAMQPTVDSAKTMGQMAKSAVVGVDAETAGMQADSLNISNENIWNCRCGKKGITTKFCPECGNKKPEKLAEQDIWNCPNCGEQGIKSKFCPECGCKKPEKPKSWDCPNCGTKDITSKFCPECGYMRPMTWICTNCGKKDIVAKFCPECGTKRPD